MGLREHRGRDCAWYMKSLSHFIRQDFRDLHKLIDECNQLFLECEAEDEQEG